jgi:phospholipid/cholesterol/gamma-HCH transport system permease protein
MSTASQSRQRVIGPPVTASTRVVSAAPQSVRSVMIEVGGILLLAYKVFSSAVRHPRGYWGMVRDELYHTLKIAWLPMILSVFCFGFFVGILSLTFLVLIGANYVYGPIMLTTCMRDFTTWINAMVVAGVIGAALTADLGARKIREELDALEVLGVDPIRTIVLPRVLSTIFLTALLSIVAVVVALLDTGVAVNTLGHLPFADYFSNVFNNVTPIEVLSVVVDSTLIGIIISIVCSYKGLNASGGSMGVGRAVNQAVVVSFVGIWILQFLYQGILLGLFPSLGTAR